MSVELPIEALKAIAHPVRLRILQALSDREYNVGEIEEASAIGQPALSQQLAVLRNAGLVLTRKEAKLVFYRIDVSRLSEVSALIGNLAGVQSDLAQAKRVPARGVANFARMS